MTLNLFCFPIFLLWTLVKVIPDNVVFYCSVDYHDNGVFQFILYNYSILSSSLLKTKITATHCADQSRYCLCHLYYSTVLSELNQSDCIILPSVNCVFFFIRFIFDEMVLSKKYILWTKSIIRVSECCFTPTQQFFSYHIARTS